MRLKYQKRLVAVYMLVLCMFTFALFRLYVISGGTSAGSVLSGQYSRKINVASRRGFIYDTNGELLNAEKEGYVCLVTPDRCNFSKEDIETLSEISGLLQSEITDKILRAVPFTLNTNEEFTARGVYCFPKYKPITTCAVHVVGYTNSDGSGVSGAEYGFDGQLSKTFGGEVTYRYSADTRGVSLKDSGSTLIDNGYSESSGVVLTIDKALQEFCEEVAKENISMGAVCVSDIKTGELLASVSLPDFDTKKIASYLESDKGEFLNRCAYGFTPGSIFKTVVAAAALEKNISLYDKEYKCEGHIELFDGRAFSCHKKTGHESLSMKDAYAQSCNVYFINLALEIGIENVLEMAEKMGLGKEKTLYGICSYGESLPEIKEEDEGFCANTAIGQGGLLITPYQALGVYSCAASGSLCELYAVKKVFRAQETLESYKPSEKKILKSSTAEKIREMMGACILEGLGKEACPEDSDAGGKTATAQTGQYKNGDEILNSWFCGVYPLSAPEYAICVLSDGNGDGGNPRIVFREICEYLGGGRNDE